MALGINTFIGILQLVSLYKHYPVPLGAAGLEPRPLDRLVRLGLPAQLDPGLGRPRQHPAAVLLDRGEVDDERRARQGADVGADHRGGHFARDDVGSVTDTSYRDV